MEVMAVMGCMAWALFLLKCHTKFAISCPLEDSGRGTGIAVGKLVSWLRFLERGRLLGARGWVGEVVRSSESSLKRGLTCKVVVLTAWWCWWMMRCCESGTWVVGVQWFLHLRLGWEEALILSRAARLAGLPFCDCHVFRGWSLYWLGSPVNRLGRVLDNWCSHS